MIVALRRRLAVGLGIAATASALVLQAPSAPAAAANSGYRSLAAPQRVLDTRADGATADGAHQRSGPVAGDTSYRLPLAGRVGLPAALSAVALNVTVTEPGAAGFVTVFPCTGTPPTASNLNYLPGQTVPNAVVTAVDDDGSVCLFVKATAHLVVDVAGWFPEGSYAALAQPARLYDSRPGRATVDQQQAGEGLRAAESVTRVKVHGRASLGSPASVVLNVTATEPSGHGFMTVYPCGVDRPNASNLNYTPNQTVPNLVVTRVGTDGEVCVFTKAVAHLLVDVAGALPDSTFVPLASPQRLLDTRPGGATADGLFAGAGRQPARATIQLDVDRAGIPADASAVVLNVTAVAPTGAGYLTTHPRGTDRPNASNVNYAANQTVANAVVARLGAGGQICVFNLAPTDVIVDVAGYLTGPAPAGSGKACPAVTPNEPGAATSIVRRPAMHVAHGNDLVAVLVCDFPGDDADVSLDAAAIAAWANETVAPWFAESSRGAFTVTFQAHPTPRVTLGSWSECIRQAPTLTPAPFTNVLVVTEENYGGGMASPGYIYPSTDIPALALPPAQSQRYAWVGGGAALVDPSVFVHEIGHTVHWPHSYTLDPEDPLTEYNNVVDVMSGQPEPPLPSKFWCQHPTRPGYRWCWAQHTLAFNRVAAGWVADPQVAIHRSGHANYALDKPAGDGVQLIALPDPADPLQLMTIEARPAIGRDEPLEVAGVAVHLIDQSGDGFHTGVSTERRHAQAVGAPNSYDHVVAPGQRLAVHGVTIEVHGSAGDGYVLAVSGTYHSPGPLPRPGTGQIVQSVTTDDPVVNHVD